jgi:microcystin-dependent protein
MTEPTTVNVALIIPNTGDLVDLWGVNAMNPDYVAIDGFLGGVQIISASNVPITLTSPAGVTITPSAGPTQAQNAVIRVTGTLSANVQVTLPLPGPIVIENLTTGNFVLSFRAVATGHVIAVDQGEVQSIYNDGTDVRFSNLGGRVGAVEIWAGISAMPAWVGACSVPPYLLCDGTVYNFSTYPYLGKRLGSNFGGNGITTFGVPDLRGRVALPYDGTASRITAAGCGLNGQTLGASLDQQNETLTLSQIPTGITSPVTVIPVNGNFPTNILGSPFQVAAGTGNFVPWWGTNPAAPQVEHQMTGTASSNNTGGLAHPNVQPSQVTGIAVIRAA